jgi:hypothetical protein
MRRPLSVVAAITTGGVLLAAAVGSADARSVGMRAWGVASCTPKRVNVKLDNGTVAAVTHATPGRKITTVSAGTRRLFIVVRLNASWATVQKTPGQTITVTATGPNGQAWTFAFKTRSARPLADPTRYLACLQPRVSTGTFVQRLRADKGPWSFAVAVTKGSLSSSGRTFTLTAR